MKICKRCGLPIQIDEDPCEVIDDMHWICYHLEFEHGDYNPDEPCDDPSCPWNRISGNDLKIIYSNSDTKIIADNYNSGVFFNVKEVETCKSTKLGIEIVLFDEHINKYTNKICIKEEELRWFYKQLINIRNIGKGMAILRISNEEEFLLKIIIKDSLDQVMVTYKVKSYKYVEAHRLNTIIENGFRIGFVELDRLINSVKDLIEMFKWNMS